MIAVSAIWLSWILTDLAPLIAECRDMLRIDLHGRPTFSNMKINRGTPPILVKLSRDPSTKSQRHPYLF